MDKIVGSYFKAHGKRFTGPSAIYFCDSYDPQQGFWMTSLSEPGHRTNVSGRAINRTFHTIYEDLGPPYCAWGPLLIGETQLIADHRAAQEVA